MSINIKFIKQRALKTVSAATSVAAKFVSQEVTADQINTQLVLITGNSTTTPPIIGQEEIVSQKESALFAAKGNWESGLDDLHLRTQQALGMAKNRFRDDPASLTVIKNLKATGKSREAILAEALAWESAWSQLDPTWVPKAGNTLAALKVLRKQCAEDLKKIFSDAETEVRDENGTLKQMGNDLEALCVTWYADATRYFPAGTAEGDMIRATVPTTYTGPADPTPPAPAPAPSPAKTL